MEVKALYCLRVGSMFIEFCYQKNHLFRYGLFSLLKLNRFVSNLLTSFASIYPRLEAGEAFPGVNHFLGWVEGN